MVCIFVESMGIVEPNNRDTMIGMMSDIEFRSLLGFSPKLTVNNPMMILNRSKVESKYETK